MILISLELIMIIHGIGYDIHAPAIEGKTNFPKFSANIP